MFDLTGQTALVTGASGGIGGAIARALHAQGATVALAGTRAPALQALAVELGERTHILTADLSQPDEPERLVKEAEAALGQLDILINNAGVTRDGLAMRMKDEDWLAVLEVNLTAGFRLIRAALRGMLRRRHGRIICVTSLVGVAGMIGMAKSIAAEVATRGITVNCIAPGFITTAMTNKLSDDQRARGTSAIPMERFGTSEEVAAAAVYLASGEAAYVTGQTLHVNGGMVMV
jgi:3-oxoacyl-[acyl-carrier protein] reductase